MATSTREAKVKFTAETSEFNSAIKSANSNLSELRSEFKLNKAQMQQTGTTVDGLTEQLEIQTSQLTEQRTKVEALSNKLEAAKSVYGENSTEVKSLTTQLNKAKTAYIQQETAVDNTRAALEKVEQEQEDSKSAYSRLSTEIAQQEAKVESLTREVEDAYLAYGKNSSELKELKSALSAANSELASSKSKMSAAENAAKDMGDAVDDASGDVKDLDSSFGNMAGASLFTDALEGVLESVTSLVDETADYRLQQEKLTVAYETSGRSADEANEAYQAFLTLCGDSDQAAEAALDMNNLADAGADISEWYGIAAGATAAFGDALPIENLIESANETVRTATVTGGLADALNWTEVSCDELNATLGTEHPAAMAAFESAIESGSSAEDAMNEALSACSDETERQEFLAGVLESQYGDLGDAFTEANSDLADYYQAQDDLTQAQSELAEAVQPLETAFMELGSVALQSVADALEDVDFATLADEMSGPLLDAIEDVDFTALAEALGTVATWVLELIAALPSIIEFFTTWAPVIAGVTAALVALKAAMSIGSLITSLGTMFTSFSAGPVVLVVAAIAGIVTALVTLWTTNDEFRDGVTGAWNTVCQAATDLASWISTNMVEPVSEALSGLVSFMGELFTDPFGTLREAGQDITTWFSTNFPGISDTVNTVMTLVKNYIGTSPFAILLSAAKEIIQYIANNFPEIKSTVKSAISGMQSFFSDPFKKLRTKVNEIIEWCENHFTLPEITIPDVKLPHFSIKGSFSLDPLSVPTFSVSWYAKGAVLDAATIFGMSGGSLLGAGEAGPEAVAPIDVLQEYVAEAVDADAAADRIVAAVESLAGRATILEIDGKAFASATASATDSVSGSRQSLVNRGVAV